MGWHDDIIPFLSVSDLYMLPSKSESFGLSALEAMAARVPVISTNAGGLPEINIHGQTGYMTDIGDVDSMSKFAIELLCDEILLEKIKQQAYDQAVRFDISNIVPEYEKLYSRFCRMDCD